MLYRKEFIIGVYYDYENNDSLIALVDNSREFADFMGITIYNASTILKAAFDKKTTFFRYRGKRAKICFIKEEF